MSTSVTIVFHNTTPDLQDQDQDQSTMYKTKTKTTACKTKTKTDFFLVSDRSCPKTDGHITVTTSPAV